MRCAFCRKEIDGVPVEALKRGHVLLIAPFMVYTENEDKAKKWETELNGVRAVLESQGWKAVYLGRDCTGLVG